VVDNNKKFLYYIIIGKLFKKRDAMNGGFNNDDKNRGLRLLTKYWVKY
jgi:hypothetical protein